MKRILLYILLFHAHVFVSDLNAQILISPNGDTLKGAIKKMTEYRYFVDYHIKGIYTWDTTQRSITTRFSDSRGMDMFGGKDFIKYDKNGHILELHRYCNGDTLCSSMIYEYDQYGRTVASYSIQYQNDHCNMQRGWFIGGITERLYGCSAIVEMYKKTYDNNGYIEKMIKDNVTVREDYNDSTIEITFFKKSNDDKVAEMKKEKVRISSGYADTTAMEIGNYIYDRNGNIRGRHANDKKEYDKKGNYTRMSNKYGVLLAREIEYY